MFRTDTGNFNRFLTSLGLLLLAAALGVPYFYFRNTGVLTFSDSELQAMTDRGRAAIIDRQDAIAALEPWVVAGAALLACAGIACLFIGGARLKAAQESEDEEVELRKDRARLEMNRLSPEERAEMVVEKASAEEQPSQAGHKPAPGEADDFEQARGGTGQRAQRTRQRGDLQRRRETVERIESSIEKVLNKAELPTHRLRLQVKMATAVDNIRLDGVFEARDDHQPDVILRSRVAFSPDIISNSARMIADEVVAQSSRYYAMTKRAADGWLVTIVPAERAADLSPEKTKAASVALDSALGSLGKAVVLPENEIDKLPSLFISQFSHTYLL